MKLRFTTMFIAYALLACAVTLVTASLTSEVAEMGMESEGQAEFPTILGKSIGAEKRRGPIFDIEFEGSQILLRRIISRTLRMLMAKNNSKKIYSSLYNGFILRKIGKNKYRLIILFKKEHLNQNI